METIRTLLRRIIMVVPFFLVSFIILFGGWLMNNFKEAKSMAVFGCRLAWHGEPHARKKLGEEIDAELDA